MAYANCNWWKYSKAVWNISRTERYLPFDEDEREAVKGFISSILEVRVWMKDRVLVSYAVTKDLDEQPDFALARILGKIGRNLKVVPPTEGEKELCDALFEATGMRQYKVLKRAEKSDSSSSESESVSASASGSESTSASGSESTSASAE